jgi:magnesium transporter
VLRRTPRTFVTGFFGQNFGWLIRHLDGFAAFAAYGIGGLVVPLALWFAWLRSRTPQAGPPPRLTARRLILAVL